MLCGRGEPQHKPSADYQLTEEEKREGHFRTEKSGGCGEKKNDRQEATIEKRRKKGRLENEADSLEVGEKKTNQIQRLNHGTVD